MLELVCIDLKELIIVFFFKFIFIYVIWQFEMSYSGNIYVMEIELKMLKIGIFFESQFINLLLVVVFYI